MMRKTTPPAIAPEDVFLPGLELGVADGPGLLISPVELTLAQVM